MRAKLFSLRNGRDIFTRFAQTQFRVPTFLLSLNVIMFSQSASAAAISLHGRILRPDGSAVHNSNVEFQIEVRTPGMENCLMYAEKLTAPVVNGLFSIAIGNNTRTDTFFSWNFEKVLSNRSPFNLTSPSCTLTSDYSPLPDAGRSILVSFRESALAPFEAMPKQALNYAPMAIEARHVAGYGSGSLLKIEGIDNRTTLSGAQFSELINLTNGDYVKSATSTGAVVPTLSGNASGAVAGSIWYDSSANQLKYYDGTLAHVVGSGTGSSGGISSINSLTALTQTFSVPGSLGSSPNWVSLGSAHTLNIPLAASPGVSAGLISTTQFDLFNSKLSSTLGFGQIFIGSTGSVATGVTPSGDLAIAGNGVTTLSAIHGQSVDATIPIEGQVFRWTSGTKWTPAFLSLADLRSTAMPGNTIFPTTSCTTGQTITWSSLTDTFICNSISISSTQVNYGSAVNAGYVFAAPAGSAGAPAFRALVTGDLPSGSTTQWSTNGANIFYGTGNVGIGSSTPAFPIDIYHSSTAGVRLSTTSSNVFLGSSTVAGTHLPFSTANDGQLVTSGPLDIGTQSNSGLKFATNNLERLTITGSGTVGIGLTNPAYMLDVVGDINATGTVRAPGVTLTSDLRFKRNIKTLGDSLEKILKLRGVSYDWRQAEFPNRKFTTRHQIGVIAQEIEAEFPELVDTNSEGYKSVNYPALISPIIESIKKLYALLQSSSEVSKAIDVRVVKLENANAELRTQTERLESENAQLKAAAERSIHENKAIKNYLCAKDPSAPICRD